MDILNKTHRKNGLITLLHALKNLSLLTFLVLFSLNFQNEQYSLVGKWECYHKEHEDGTTKGKDIFTDEEFTISCHGLTLKLNADFTGSESFHGLKFNYQKKDSILRMGDRSFIIELLNKNNLQIRDYSTDKTDLGGAMRMKFKRLK